jgi:RNA 2',3'-cyclic 3'-phosphodiesterase
VSARLFIAVDLPGDVRSALAAWGREAAGADLALRPVGIESLHVTLAFLGHRALDDIEPLARVVREVDGAPAELRVGEAIWLSPRRPSVLAVALGDVSGELGRLQQAAATGAAEAVGWVPERRRFLPHVTGARVRRGYAPRRSGVPPPPAATFTARTMTLYRSHLGGRGPARYEPLERVALDAAVGYRGRLRPPPSRAGAQPP